MIGNWPSRNVQVAPHAARAAIRALAAAAFLANVGARAQPLEWRDDGTFDQSAHLGRLPADPDLAPGPPPGYTAAIARPAGLKVQPSGMGLLPDGLLALAHWGGFGRKGSILLLEGLPGPPEGVKATEIAKDLWEPMGLQVVDGEIHFTAQDGLWRLARVPGQPERWEPSLEARFVIPIKEMGGDFPIALNTAYHAGSFYYGTGAYKNFNPPGKNEGYIVRVDRATGAQSILARGVRMPNGLAANAAGDLFYADNQGEFRPSSAIFHVVAGRHFGMAAPDGREGNLGGFMTRFLPLPPANSIFPPAVHIPYRPGSASLTNLFRLDRGPFAGQFLAGDNALGTVHRVQPEKVEGEYQGACFQFSTVLEGGIQSFAAGADGTIYGGTLGYGSNGWSWLGRAEGLMRWTPDGRAFDAIASVHSHREGFDLRFTDPLGDRAADPALYWVSSWRYEPTEKYGGPRLDVHRHAVKALRASADRKAVALTIEGLARGRVYRIALAPEMRTAAGRPLFTRNAWYTLHRIAPVPPLASAPSSGHRQAAPPAHAGLRVLREGAGPAAALRVLIPGAGAFDLRLLGLDGGLRARASGTGPAAVRLAAGGPGARILVVGTSAGVCRRLLEPAP